MGDFPAAWGDTYAGTPYPDGAGNSIFTLGRHNKWGAVLVMGPNGVHRTLGLVDGFDVTEDNGSAYLPQAGGDWLELQIGSRTWSGTMTRAHVRGADMKRMMMRLYPKAGDVDFRYLPFVFAYSFDYKPPIGLKDSIETARWQYHKAIVVRYTNQPITGPNRLLTERVEWIAAGEEYHEQKAVVYQSPTWVWQGGFYPQPAASSATAPSSNATNTAITLPTGAGTGNPPW